MRLVSFETTGKLAVIEEKTRNISLVNCFTRLDFREFPSPPLSFTVYAALSDGLGRVCGPL
jgi:hypothetical protein